MYKLYIYCKAAFPLTVQQKDHLERKKIKPNDVTVRRFGGKDELFAYVRKYDYYSRTDEWRNHILDATMCNTNDSLRHKQSFDRQYPNRWSMEDDVYHLGYLIKDEKDRVIDFRNYTDELYAFDLKAYEKTYWAIRRKKWEEEYEIRDAKWEKDKQLREGEHYWSYYRRIRTTQERRHACISEYAGLIRGKRSCANLPNSWDDFYFHREKSWKARCKSANRQYEINLKKHIYTVKITSTFDEDVEVVI